VSTLLHTAVTKDRRIKKTETLLTRARDLLAEESAVGWCKGTEHKVDEDGGVTSVSVCAIGAVEAVSFGLGIFRDESDVWSDYLDIDKAAQKLARTAVEALHAAPYNLHGSSCGDDDCDTGADVAYVNDGERTTKDEVLAIFDEAIRITQGAR
jgi:hypothetical protein